MSKTNHTLTIARRELVSYFTSPVAYVFVVIFLALQSFFTFQFGYAFFEARQADLLNFFRWLPWLYMILVPAITMRTWAEERRSGTMELILTLPIRPWQAILGKFIAAWTLLAVALLLTFPIVITAYYLGKPDGGAIVAGYTAALLLAGAYAAIGMFTSSLTRNQVVSFIVAVVIGFVMIIIGFPPATRLLDGLHLPQGLVQGIASVSFIPHYEWMQRGVVDLKDIAFFASVIVFMLTATHVVLDSRRGK